MSEASDGKRRREEWEADLAESKQGLRWAEEKIQSLEEQLRQAKEQKKEHEAEIRRLNQPPFDDNSELPPWESRGKRCGDVRVVKTQWRMLTTAERKEYWEQWAQCQREETKFDAKPYAERMHAQYNEMLTAKAKALLACLGDKPPLKFNVGGRHFRHFVERAVCDDVVGVSLYDWLMVNKDTKLPREPEEIVMLLNEHVVADHKDSECQDTSCSTFYWKVLDSD